MSIVMAASMLSTLRLYQLVSGSKTSANPFALEWMGAAFEVWGGGTHAESDRRNLWMPQKSGYRKLADNGAKIAHQGREICDKEKRSQYRKACKCSDDSGWKLSSLPTQGAASAPDLPTFLWAES
jgi:hypothetical protein